MVALDAFDKVIGAMEERCHIATDNRRIGAEAAIRETGGDFRASQPIDIRGVGRRAVNILERLAIGSITSTLVVAKTLQERRHVAAGYIRHGLERAVREAGGDFRRSEPGNIAGMRGAPVHIGELNHRLGGKGKSSTPPLSIRICRGNLARRGFRIFLLG